MRRALIAMALIVSCGCAELPGSAPAAAESASKTQPATLTAGESPKLAITKPAPTATPHLHNLLKLTPTLYSGSEPHGEQAFAELATLGVKVVISVDGAKPDVASAKKHGIRYVHIPIGYDGIPQEAGLAFARVVRETGTAGQPIYVHCHHGKHRGPAAAAAVCIAAGAATNEEAKEILVTAGTSKDYPGLWRDVAAYVTPAPDAQLPELVEIATVGSLTAAMSSIDRGFDNLKLSQAGGWKLLPDHPDIVATQEAIIVREALHESGRNLAAGYDAEFAAWLREAEGLAARLEAQLKASDSPAAAQTMVKLEASCKQCHTKHRNN
jgi:hypothetical protein